jgi:hypothetical protein
VAELGLSLSSKEIVELTGALRERAEQGSLNQQEVDTFIHTYYFSERVSEARTQLVAGSE